jgi:hypothetical protein
LSNHSYCYNVLSVGGRGNFPAFPAGRATGYASP